MTRATESGNFSSILTYLDDVSNNIPLPEEVHDKKTIDTGGFTFVDAGRQQEQLHTIEAISPSSHSTCSVLSSESRTAGFESSVSCTRGRPRGQTSPYRHLQDKQRRQHAGKAWSSRKDNSAGPFRARENRADQKGPNSTRASPTSHGSGCRAPWDSSVKEGIQKGPSTEGTSNISHTKNHKSLSNNTLGSLVPAGPHSINRSAQRDDRDTCSRGVASSPNMMTAAVSHSLTPPNSARGQSNVPTEEKGHTGARGSEHPGPSEGQARRWVWDEWDVASFSMVDDESSRNDRSSGWGRHGGSNNQTRCVTSYPPPLPPRHSASPVSGFARGGNSTMLSTGDGVRARVSKECMADPYTCTPAVRQAFEDIQATAQAMRDDLKEKRSQVLNFEPPT